MDTAISELPIANYDYDKELADIKGEIQELEEVLGDLGLDEDEEQASSSELDEFNKALEASEFSDASAESTGELTLLQIVDGEFSQQSMQEGFFGDVFKKATGFVRKKAKKTARRILKKAIKYAKRHKKCLPKVTKALAYFAAGKYVQTIKMGYSAIRCAI